MTMLIIWAYGVVTIALLQPRAALHKICVMVNGSLIKLLE